jgi:uncharacterized protein YqgV (UPF0045/DUF77 family)
MSLNPNRTLNVAVQVLPLTSDPFPLIHKAIAVIQASGVTYEVDAMETVMEGPLDRLLEIARQAHLACMEGGAEQVVTVIKIGDRQVGTTIAEKVDRFRGQA